jgi:hypothetical protein
MRKSHKTKPPVRKRPSPRRLNEAISLLARWANEGERVHYIDGSSGLQHPGVITKLNSGIKGLGDEFMFIAKSGDFALIYPMLWTKVHCESVVGESACITEYDRSYVLRSLRTREEAEASKKTTGTVETQLSKWAALKAQLSIFFVGPFPPPFFFGTLAVRENGYFVATTNSGLSYLISCRDGVCKIEKHGDNVAVQITGDQYAVYISETELTAFEMMQRFHAVSPAVH